LITAYPSEKVAPIFFFQNSQAKTEKSINRCCQCPHIVDLNRPLRSRGRKTEEGKPTFKTVKMSGENRGVYPRGMQRQALPKVTQPFHHPP
jgi:hypothetical protein